MIGEAVVLLRVQDLQKGGSGVSVVGAGELVYLVQNHHGIGDGRLLDAVHDPPRHGTDIGPAVPPDIRLVSHSAQADAGILSPQSLRDGLSDAGLPGSGRAHKEEDGAGLLLLQIHHGDLLYDSLLDLFQAEVVLIQDLFRLIEGDFLRLLLFPGEACHEVEIVIEHPGLLSVHALLLQTV